MDFHDNISIIPIASRIAAIRAFPILIDRPVTILNSYDFILKTVIANYDRFRVDHTLIASIHRQSRAPPQHVFIRCH